MEKETNKSKIIFITALVCIALCIPIGVLLGRTLLGKNESNKTNNNVVNKQNIIDKNSNEYKDAEKVLNSFENEFKISYKILYNGNYNIKNISDEDKLKSVIKLMENDGLIKGSCEKDRDVITYDKLNEYLNSFNSKVLNIESNEKYNEDIIKSLTKKYGSEVYSLDYYYNIEFKNNGLDISGPCTETDKIKASDRIIKVEKENNNYIVYAKIYFNNANFIYKDYAGKDVIYQATIENNFIVDDNLDKFDTYKYTFKIDNGNYTFVSLEKI